MIRIHTAACAAILAFTSLSADTASAQPQVPVGPGGRPPVVSPFLGLAGGGFGNPALNYFSFVQPQVQMQQQLGQLQFQQQQFMMTGRGGMNPQGDPATLLPSTSSVPVFDNTFGYFNRLNGAGGGVSVGGGGGISPMGAGGIFARPPAAAAAATGAATFNRGMTPGMGQPSFAAPRSPAPSAPVAPAVPQ
jgi:hypothetical protein